MNINQIILDFSLLIADKYKETPQICELGAEAIEFAGNYDASQAKEIYEALLAYEVKTDQILALIEAFSVVLNLPHEETHKTIDLQLFANLEVSKRSLNEIRKVRISHLETKEVLKFYTFCRVVEHESEKVKSRRMTMAQCIEMVGKFVTYKGVARVIKENSGMETSDDLAMKICEALNNQILERGVFWKLTKNDCIAQLNNLIKKGMIVNENNQRFILREQSPLAVLPQFERDEDMM